MEITIHPHKLEGSIPAIPSKSQAHRLLLCAAFADNVTDLICPQTNRDIQATVDCLNAIGADITRTSHGYRIRPIRTVPDTAVLNCCESGSTLRFLLPIAGALGIDARFSMEGRLSQRPLSPLWEEMERMGCRLTRPDADHIRCQGKLHPGLYQIDGGVSSQFVTGLLFALSLLDDSSTLELTGQVESVPYIRMTQTALSLFGVDTPQTDWRFCVKPAAFHTPGQVQTEGDWSNAAFWLAAKSLGSSVTVSGLMPDSPQGDRAAAHWLEALEHWQQIDAAHIPDLVPILAVVAGAKKGAVFTNAGRLRIKESDRLESAAQLIRELGGCARIEGDRLIVHGTGYSGGKVDAFADHRIAMSAAIAATVCSAPVTITGAEAVAKSYPSFWNDYQALGGIL